MNAPRPPEREQLPSGKTIMRLFNQDGSLYEETHSYGVIDLGISSKFRDGKKIEETYFVKSRLVSRRTYERARAKYADMPTPDTEMEDWGADLLKGVRREKQQHQEAAKRHIPDAEEARRLDDFCVDLMARGKCANAVEWIEAKSHTLGEIDSAGSRKLLKSLCSNGCKKIYACEIECDEFGENTGHLVIELPTTGAARQKVLKRIDTLAREQGYDGPFDDGQRYAYVKLD